MFIYVYKYEKINGFQLEMFYFLYYYIINIGFEEEIIFRGYLWPRLVVLLGKFLGTFLTCACFGVAHSFMPIILGDTSQGIGDWVELALQDICFMPLFTLVIIIYSSPYSFMLFRYVYK